MPSGQLAKMQVVLHPQGIDYALPLGDELLALNPLLGKELQLVFDNAIHCIACKRKIKKSFNQGYCFPCSQRLAACDICILRPELCHFDQGTCREPEWAQTHCMQKHFVYLANTSAVKVGITRASQIPTRWIDQGANQALPIYQTRNRYIAGLLEVAIKKFVTDRTDWRRMLKGDAQPENLIGERDKIWLALKNHTKELLDKFGESGFMRVDEKEVVQIQFPVSRYPEKIKSLNFDKTAEISGELLGMKGQYLILDTGVLNVRKFTGYHISVHA
jgi:hypothetical protein